MSKTYKNSMLQTRMHARALRRLACMHSPVHHTRAVQLAVQKLLETEHRKHTPVEVVRSVVSCLHVFKMWVVEVCEERPEDSSVLQMRLPNDW